MQHNNKARRSIQHYLFDSKANSIEDKAMSDSGSDSDDSTPGEKVRISLTLSSECHNRNLEVPSEPIAVPADIGRKGLSAVINHLLGRNLGSGDASGSESDDDDQLPSINFDFILGRNNKLLRTALEREARRTGISLEEAIPVTYFPSQDAPELKGESDTVPDWISSLSYAPSSSLLCAGCYDGSIQLFQTKSRNNKDVFEKISTKPVHNGPIKCLSTMKGEGDVSLYIATGSMDHTLALHTVDSDTHKVKLFARLTDGHGSAIGALDFFPADQTLASGDWDGGICLWNIKSEPVPDEEEHPSKKSRKDSDDLLEASPGASALAPIVSIQAHSSKISGISWGNFEKNDASRTAPEHLITGSWDHSLKVWNTDRQDCLLTLNGSRVISCLDTSYHSSAVVATGHPDCTVRLWDVRSGNEKESALSVSDNTFRPSHKAWVSAVQWSRSNPYHLASTSHDGVVKLWDIRSSLPLHTVRAFDKTEKGLSLVYGDVAGDHVYVGGTDCIVKQFICGKGDVGPSQ